MLSLAFQSFLFFSFFFLISSFFALHPFSFPIFPYEFISPQLACISFKAIESLVFQSNKIMTEMVGVNSLERVLVNVVRLGLTKQGLFWWKHEKKFLCMPQIYSLKMIRGYKNEKKYSYSKIQSHRNKKKWKLIRKKHKVKTELSSKKIYTFTHH